MKYRIVCTETVETEFFVESPNGKRVHEWLEEKGADVVSGRLESQQVSEREYYVERCHDEGKADYATDS